jgi:hypothetical protein
VNNAIIAAARRARVLQSAETINPFDSPPAWRSALREHQERKPRPPPGTTIAIHAGTDASAILKRILGEDDRRRAVGADRKRRWRAARSADQVGRDRVRDREAARRRRAQSPPFAG